MPADPRSELTPSAELFAEFLSRRVQGQESDFEAFCAAHPERADELRKLERHARIVDAALGGAGEPTGEERYEIRDEVARGGMGVVLRAFDRMLQRKVAIKIGDAPATDARASSRFLDEARITGQLEHPGIVPIYDLGINAQSRFYFTMPLLRGRTLREVIELVHEGDGEWTLARALGVLLAVCDAVASAHAKGVIHRDLKPSNVMVGKFGETYVVDWGLARVLSEADHKDIRLREVVAPSSVLHGTRRELAEDDPDSPLITMDGDVVGTPAYMPPEQARGEVQRMGPRSDVYAAGAMLYHVLAGEMPYVPKGAHVSARTVLARVLDGPPRPLPELNRRAPPELVAICSKAMAREPEDRYADMRELAADLRAFLELRVVRAYGGGAWTELRKWVRRNRTAAAAGLVAVLALASGLVFTLVANRRVGEAAVRATTNFALAEDAVDELVTIAGDELANVPQMESARRRMLERALAFHLRFAGVRSDDPAVLERAAQAWRRVGEVRRDLGQLEEARAAFLEGRQVLQRVLHIAPDRHDLARDAAWDLNEIACVDELRGKWAAALEGYRVAADQLATLARAHPEVADYRARWLHVLHNCVVVLNAQKKYGDALLLADQVLGEREAMARAFPGDERYMSYVAGAQAGRAYTLWRVSRVAEAALQQQAAAETYDQLLAQHADNQDYRDRTALAWSQLSIYLRKAKPPEARRAAERAVELRRAMVRNYPHVPLYHSNLGGSLSNLADVLIDAGDLQGARQCLEEAIGEQQSVGMASGHEQVRRFLWSEYRSLLHLLEKLGDHAELARRAEDLLRDAPNEEQNVLASAGRALVGSSSVTHADATLAAGERERLVAQRAGRGIELMDAAFEKGWRPANLEAAVFDVVRQRADFRSLEAKVLAAKPKSRPSSGK